MLHNHFWSTINRMLRALLCLVGVFGLLIIDDILAKANILKVEFRRKFIHISVGTFVAFWPWIISFRYIQFISLGMLAVVTLNQLLPIFNFNNDLKRKTYGDYFFAMAILACAILTTSKVFFMIAILHLALADAAGALVGRKFGARWRYKVFGYTKTIIGSMAFWLTSLIIVGVGTLFANNLISFNDYVLLLAFLPPLLTLLENLSIYGIDNLVIPIIVIAALRLAQ